MRCVAQKRKLIWMGLILTFSFLPVNEVVAQTCVAPPPGLVSWWPGDGDATDIAGSNNGVLQNGATFATGFVTSRNGQAFSFDGLDDFVDVGNTPTIPFTGAGSFTMSMWFKTSSTATTNLMDTRQTSTNKFTTLITVPPGVIAFQVRDRRANRHYATSSTTINDGQFHHVAVVRDGSKNEPGAMEIFIDGQKEVLSSETGGTVSGDLHTAQSMQIGGGLNGFFDGIIDEFAIYDRALNSTEILAIFDAGSAGKCKIPPAVADALADAGIDPSGVPPEVLDALIAADGLGLLDVIPPSTTANQNLVLPPDGAVVLGEGSLVNGNIEGGAGNTVVFGGNSTVDGNIVGVGLSFVGGSNVEINGNFEDAMNELLVGPGAQVHFTGSVQAATLEIEDGGAVLIDGNLHVSGSLELGPNASLVMGGSLGCDPGATASIDPTATVGIGGNDECSAL